MNYTVILEQERDGGYVAIVPALPGCVSQGETRAEVMANIREAAELYIEDYVTAGDAVPNEAGQGRRSSVEWALQIGRMDCD